MSKQDERFSRCGASGTTTGVTLRIGALVVIVAVVTGACLVFMGNAFAHSIELEAAREKARDYARSVRKDPGRNYLHYATDCVRAFPGHNHYVRCTIFFQNAKDKERGKWTCKERIEVYHEAHGRAGPGGIIESFGSGVMHIKHTSKKRC